MRSTTDTGEERRVGHCATAPMPTAHLASCDWPSGCFLGVDSRGKRWWCFDDGLSSCGVPKQLAALVTEVTAAVHSVDEEALSMREAGLLGQYDEMMHARRALHEQRVECLQPF